MQIEIQNRKYTEWIWREIGTNKIINNNKLDPLKLKTKLFNGDIVEENGDLRYSKYHSTQIQTQITGTLLLSGKTYGRDKNNNKRLLYICIPADKKLPLFLIPYEEKTINFNKEKIDKYILFHFKEWIDKHPLGIITNTIGYVNEIESYYEYQLYSKNLNTSIQSFIKETTKAIQPCDEKCFIRKVFEFYNNKNYKNKIEDRTKEFNIFSIDPKGSLDFDDAFSIQEYSDYILISVYIANVPLILDYLQLWNSFTNRVSTIYLPNGKKNMLPPILADNLCSLQANKERLAFTMDIKYKLSQNKVSFIDISFTTTLINVYKNFIYEEESLLKFYNYSNLFTVTKYIQQINPYLNDIKDSHDIVAYYMIMMNYECSKKMIEKKIGILRITRENEKINEKMKEQNDNFKFNFNFNKTQETQLIIPAEIKQFINIWHSELSGIYCDTNTSYSTQKGHSLIANGLPSYTHITSPIRRLVDLINLIEIQKSLNLIDLNDNANDFCKRWIENIDYINESTKSIKRVQQNSILMNALSCSTQIQSQNDIYNGFIIEKIILNDCDNKIFSFKYNVYIPSLKTISSFKSNDKTLPIYSQHNFIIKIFLDELTYKNKVRLQKV